MAWFFFSILSLENFGIICFTSVNQLLFSSEKMKTILRHDFSLGFWILCRLNKPNVYQRNQKKPNLRCSRCCYIQMYHVDVQIVDLNCPLPYSCYYSVFFPRLRDLPYTLLYITNNIHKRIKVVLFIINLIIKQVHYDFLCKHVAVF